VLGSELGYDGLHALELEQFISAAASPTPAILGAAAAVILEPAAQAVLSKHFVVYLRARVETLARRVASGRGRPFLETEQLAVLQRLLEPRAPLYEQFANLVVDVDDIAAAQISAKVAKAMALEE